MPRKRTGYKEPQKPEPPAPKVPEEPAKDEAKDVRKRVAEGSESRKREQLAATEVAVRTLDECGVPWEEVSDEELRRMAQSAGEGKVLTDSNDVVYESQWLKQH